MESYIETRQSTKTRSRETGNCPPKIDFSVVSRNLAAGIGGNGGGPAAGGKKEDEEKRWISHPISRTRFAIKIFTGARGHAGRGKIESVARSRCLSIPAAERNGGGREGSKKDRTAGCPLGDTFNRLVANAFQDGGPCRWTSNR